MTKCKFIFNTLLLLTALNLNPAIAAFDPATELKIIAADGASGDWFGAGISLDGTRIAVGARQADISGNLDQGAVYIYDFNGSDWNQVAKLTAYDGTANDWFGVSVSLSGDRLAVGAYQADISGNTSQGAVYVFDLSGAVSTWNGSQQRLIASDGASHDAFGISVSLSGSRLAVGSVQADIRGNANQGAAYIFDFSGGSWSETQKLVAVDGAANDFFGRVFLDGDRLAVGAWRASISGNSQQGAAYVFDLTGGHWNQTAKLTAADGAYNDQFGWELSLSGNRLAVGATQANIARGAVYVFDLSGSVWNQTAKLTASDGVADYRFGDSLFLSGDRLAVGADGASSTQGAAYVFDLNGSDWNETQKLTASDGATNNYFGYPVSLNGNHLAVGASGFNNYQGVAYIYTCNLIFKNGFD